MKYLTLLLVFTLAILGYYGLVWEMFYSYEKNLAPTPTAPVLRARFGTVMWHSSIDYGYNHVYCYYPTSEAQYESQGGEYLLKRVENLDDCQNFLGTAIFQEDPWVSETQKIWWPNSRSDRLAVDNNEPQRSI